NVSLHTTTLYEIKAVLNEDEKAEKSIDTLHVGAPCILQGISLYANILGLLTLLPWCQMDHIREAQQQASFTPLLMLIIYGCCNCIHWTFIFLLFFLWFFLQEHLCGTRHVLMCYEASWVQG
ncbi:hypothetical protein, partial [Salmonella enterica]|uniref:hypothetical protein n=1 Tax=Salmonella enterica TaxID=28901 RepID=UPI003523326A